MLETVKMSVGDLRNLAISIGIILAAVVLGLILQKILSFILSRWRRSHLAADLQDDLTPKNWRGPLRALLPALLIMVALPLLKIPSGVMAILRQALLIWIIASLAWLITRMLSIIKDFILKRYRIEEKDNLQARRMYTQLGVIERILKVLIIFLALAFILLTFEKVRQIGFSLLASAGILSIILGFSAQKSLATLFAGIQIALTQPIRIDDVVIVENEWGWIEEITLTYVVVRIWDQRRLVVPITYFIEKPFQNWTRVTADILGTVFLYMDYTVPFDAVRKELQRILKASDLWDKKVCVLQVTNATERAVELRALMSAPDASTAWSLRCEVREKLIDFIQKKYPKALPRFRAEMDPPKLVGKTGLKKVSDEHG